jgi:hypothetical protein
LTDKSASDGNNCLQAADEAFIGRSVSHADTEAFFYVTEKLLVIIVRDH